MTAKKSDLKNYAYEIIKNNIINCKYKPGDILTEQLLTEEIKTSRTPIREALRCIEQEKYIRIIPKKGILVNEITLSDVSEIFQMRELLEPFVIGASANNVKKEELLEIRKLFDIEDDKTLENQDIQKDMLMHKYFVERCNNRFVIDLMNTLYDQNTRIVISTNQNLRLHDARSEHLEIIDLVIQGDFVKAADSMKKHIQICKKTAFKHFLN